MIIPELITNPFDWVRIIEKAAVARGTPITSDQRAQLFIKLSQMKQLELDRWTAHVYNDSYVAKACEEIITQQAVRAAQRRYRIVATTSHEVDC